MKDYFSLDEISREIEVSKETIRKKCYQLGIDTKEIDIKSKKILIDALAETIQRKTEAKEFLNELNSGESEAISMKNESTLEQRLYIAKMEFNRITKSLEECQIAIDKKGTIMMNGNNGTVSSNPAVKTKCELLKQQNALQKTISDLEQSLKMSIPSKDKKIIDDE